MLLILLVNNICLQETCKRLENAGQPLQHTIKSQNTYESVQHRVTELCKAFQVIIIYQHYELPVDKV